MPMICIQQHYLAGGKTVEFRLYYEWKPTQPQQTNKQTNGNHFTWNSNDVARV